MQNYHHKTTIRLQILLILLIIGWNSAEAQNGIKMINATIFNPEQYKEFSGSPYLWKDNQEVVIYDKEGKEHKSIMGNYNGLDNEFEVYQNNEFIQLPHSSYPNIKVINNPDIQYSLSSNVHSELKNQYCIQHKKTDNYAVYESFTAKKSVVHIETPGKPTDIKKINPRTEYYLVIRKELIQFKINQKKLIKQFGHKKEVNSFLKENKIKINEIDDAIQLFEYLDAQGWLSSSN